MVKKLGVWILSVFEEDHGKGSIKRWLALLAFILIAIINIYTRLHYLDANALNFASSLTDALLVFIATLLGMTYIPTRKDGGDQK